MPFQPIYTERNSCQDCYKCIRNCPVKAIKIEEHKAMIISELCVTCGLCYEICPSKAKRVKSNVGEVKHLLSGEEKVIVSIAPSFYTEFPEYSDSQVIELFRNLGFDEVSETAIGADIVSTHTAKYIKGEKPDIYISSACPSVVELVEKYYPHLSENIIPAFSPMIAHGKWLKEKYGKNTRVVFVGPCIAKKKEVEVYQGYIDAAITFRELKQWLDEENITVSEDSNNSFYPFKAGRGSIYPIDGGMIDTINRNAGVTDLSYMSFSGVKNIQNILGGLDKIKLNKPLFLELLSCEGGCINGLGMSCEKSTAERRIDIITKSVDSGSCEMCDASTDVTNNIKAYAPVYDIEHSEHEIKDALKTIGKHTEQDNINCGACGYQSCRELAIALLDDKADRSMCVSYMRNVAQNKATVLLQKMPYGVVIVDEYMKVIESNQHFAMLMGEEVERVYDIKPGLKGSSLKKIVPFHQLFENYLHSGQEEYQKDIRHNNKLFHISLFAIQKHKIVCGIMHDMKTSELKKDEVIKRSRNVIKKNLETVQKIAFLLGENASQTESILNSIVESYSDNDEK